MKNKHTNTHDRIIDDIELLWYYFFRGETVFCQPYTQSETYKLLNRRKQKEKSIQQYIEFASPIGRSKRSNITCCDILVTHGELLKSDPNRLSTDFIKRMSKCDCKEVEK